MASSSSSSSSSSPWTFLFFTLCYFISVLSSSSYSADLSGLFYTTSTTDHVQYVDEGKEIHLALDQKNASGFQSYDAFVFGYFNMRIKLVPGDSAGTVTTYYFSSIGDDHDELDFEFLGNSSGEPLILQTNVFSSGHGEREQRILLWFDPTADFHNYTILWNLHHVVFFVDQVPIRVFPNIEAQTGLPYLHNRSMNVFATIWDGDSWATEGGRVKINWTHAPFVASYRDFSADACSRSSLSAPESASAYSECAASKWWNGAAYQALDESQVAQLKWVQTKMTVYDYCTDFVRYNVTPPECLYQFNPVFSTNASSPSPSPSVLPSSASSPSPSPLPSSSISPSPSSPSPYPSSSPVPSISLPSTSLNSGPPASPQGSNSHRFLISPSAFLLAFLNAVFLYSSSLIL